MKIVENKVNYALSNFKENSLIESFDAMLELMSLLTPMLDFLYTAKEAEEMGHDPEQLAYTLVSQVEMLDGFSKSSMIEYAAKNRVFLGASFSDKLHLASINLTELMEIITPLALAGVPLSDSSVENIRPLVKSIVGNLAYAMYFGFNFFEINEAIKAGKDFEVQSFIIKALEIRGLEVTYLTRYLESIFNAYKPPLGIFDQAPEYEADFYAKAGSAVDSFLAHEEYLTLDFVIRVLEDDTKAEEVAEEFLQFVAKEKAANK